MTKEEAFEIGLPKWPQCVINGDKITPEQALEIIRRTDQFFIGYFGNKHHFNAVAAHACKLPIRSEFRRADGDNWREFDEYRAATDKFLEEWQYVPSEYLHNEWISCSWVGGYHGWCHPNGTIAYCNNIGRWPGVEDVYNDLCTIGQAFPFLNLTCTLMNDEEDYATCSLVSMKLSNGKVEFIDTIPIEELQFNGIKIDAEDFLNRSENYFTIEQIKEMADNFYARRKETA